VIPRYALAPIALAAIVAGCGGAASQTPTASTPAESGPPGAEPTQTSPSLTPVPGSSAEPAPSEAGVPTTTETDWGAIWDALPPSFPREPSWAPVDPIEGPASGAFAIGASGEDVATQMQGALELANYSTFTMSGPFEDGSYVIESIGATELCRVETRITPLSGVTHVRVRVSADCPFE
jgi:hypothetical protein